MVLFCICVETSGLILSSRNKQQLLLVVVPLKYENCLGSKVWTNSCFAKSFHQPSEQELAQSMEENPEKKAVFLPMYHCKEPFKSLALKWFNKFYIFIFISRRIFQILHTSKIDGVVNHLLLNTKGIKQRLIWLMTACSCRIKTASAWSDLDHLWNWWGELKMKTFVSAETGGLSVDLRTCCFCKILAQKVKSWNKCIIRSSI